MTLKTVLPFTLGVLLALSGCGRKEDHAAHATHVHVSPHGGLLVELGEHAYNAELVRDTDAGKLTVYILDGHAENFVRLALPSIDLVAYAGGERRTLALRAVANSITGETVGNTSQYEAQADWLKSVGAFNGEIGVVEIRGTKFGPAAFALKK